DLRGRGEVSGDVDDRPVDVDRAVRRERDDSGGVLDDQFTVGLEPDLARNDAGTAAGVDSFLTGAGLRRACRVLIPDNLCRAAPGTVNANRNVGRQWPRVVASVGKVARRRCVLAALVDLDARSLLTVHRLTNERQDISDECHS